MSTRWELDRFLSEKRLRKATQRQQVLSKRALQSRLKVELERERFGKRSRIVRMLASSFLPEVRPFRKETVIRVPSTFSIIEDPETAIRTIQYFAKAAFATGTRRFFIDQTRLKTYDLAANALLDLVASELVRESRQRRVKVRFRGSYPNDPHVKRFIRAMGIIKHLDIKHEFVCADETSRIRLFDQRNCHYQRNEDPRKADTKARVIREFADHINQCLKDHKQELTPEARHQLCDYIGEILCNAEDHPKFVDWTIQGYLDNTLEVPICEIAIFNFGKSISETLGVLKQESYTYKQIEPYVALHSMRRFFSPQWRRADLLTLIALQSHVSSKNITEKDTRGQGTAYLIDFFQSVHAKCAENSPIKAKMAIVSGGTYILFDGTHRMKETEGKGKTIAFNKANDLYVKPDENYVKPLRGLHFPGTIISIRFPLSTTSTVTLDEV